MRSHVIALAVASVVGTLALADDPRPATLVAAAAGRAAPSAAGVAAPAAPGAAAPSAPGAAAPSAAGTVAPGAPGTAAPSAPGAAAPSAPGTAAPSAPGAAAPNAPGAPTITAPGSTAQQSSNTSGTVQITVRPGAPSNTRAVPAGSTLNSGDTLLNDGSSMTGGVNSTGGANTTGRPAPTGGFVSAGDGSPDSGDTLLNNGESASSESVQGPRQPSRNVQVQPFAQPNPANSVDRSGGPIRGSSSEATGTGGAQGATSGAPGWRY